jgi:hypothetical protein
MSEPTGETRAQALIRTLDLKPHPEGGWYQEVFRSARLVQPDDKRPPRRGLTTIDFLLERGQFSAWHRVQSDEVWHLLEGDSLTLWLLPPDLSDLQQVSLNRSTRLRHVVPADWWQAAETAADFAYVGATVGPGFDFADFTFGRDDSALKEAAARLGTSRLL